MKIVNNIIYYRNFVNGKVNNDRFHIKNLPFSKVNSVNNQNNDRKNKSDWFTIERIDENTSIISEYKHWEETHCYVLNDTKRCLLIDTGLGVENIWEQVQNFGIRL